MSHFYGQLSGQAGTATRTGSKNSGISATVRSWSGNLDTRLLACEGGDVATIAVRPEHAGSVTLGEFHHKAVLDALAARDKRTLAAVHAVSSAFARLDNAAAAHAKRGERSAA